MWSFSTNEARGWLDNFFRFMRVVPNVVLSTMNENSFMHVSEKNVCTSTSKHNFPDLTENNKNQKAARFI